MGSIPARRTLRRMAYSILLRASRPTKNPDDQREEGLVTFYVNLSVVCLHRPMPRWLPLHRHHERFGETGREAQRGEGSQLDPRPTSGKDGLCREACKQVSSAEARNRNQGLAQRKEACADHVRHQHPEPLPLPHRPGSQGSAPRIGSQGSRLPGVRSQYAIVCHLSCDVQ